MIKHGLPLGWQVRIRENGIASNGGLLKWDRIYGYQWKGETLCLSVDGLLPHL